MSILADAEIRTLAEDEGLIRPFDSRALQGASYDLCLGQLMVVEGSPRRLALRNESYCLEPGGFVLLTTLEELRMPGDLIGHAGIMSTWARRGLVSLFSPQIDPGFQGILEIPLFNAGDAAVVLIPGDAMFTVEFGRTGRAATFLWRDRHGLKSPPTQPLPPRFSRPNLQDIAVVRQLQEQVRREFEEVRDGIDLSVARLAVEFARLDKQVEVLSARLESNVSQTSLKFGHRQIVVGVAAIAVTVAVFLAGQWFGGSSTLPASGGHDQVPAVVVSPSASP